MLDRMSLLFRFSAIAEAGSVRKAAETLNIAQPALSRSLSQLEKAYGQKLLERHARGVRPTAFGQRLLSNIDRLARDWEIVETELASGSQSAEGRLRVSGGPFWASIILPEIIVRLHARFPNLTVEVHSDTDQAATRLLEGQIDMTFGGLFAPDRNNRQLEYQVFTMVRDRVTARADHPIHQCRPDDYQAVHDYPWAVYSPDPIYETETLHGVMERTGFLPQIRVRSNSLLSIQQLLTRGDYLCMLPDAAVRNLPGPPLKPIPIEMGHRQSESGALYRSTNAHYPPLRAMLELCAERFAKGKA